MSITNVRDNENNKWKREQKKKKKRHEEAKDRRKLKWKSKWFCCALS